MTKYLRSHRTSNDDHNWPGNYSKYVNDQGHWFILLTFSWATEQHATKSKYM